MWCASSSPGARRRDAESYTLLVVGVLAVSGALLGGNAAGIRVAGVVLAAGALVFAATLARVLHHGVIAQP